jgi:hypothetical protein
MSNAKAIENICMVLPVSEEEGKHQNQIPTQLAQCSHQDYQRIQ